MDTHVTEEQQIDALRKWWKENGKSVIAGLVLGLGVLFAVRAWHDHLEGRREAASIEYEQLRNAIQRDDRQAIVARGERLISTYPKTAYAVLSALALARTETEAGEHDAAKARLQWVLDHAENPVFLHVARIRLARILVADDKAAQALSMLKAVEEGQFSSSYEELKGDIYVALGQAEQARRAYEAALAALSRGVDAGILRMKLDNLGLEAGS